MHWPEFFDSSRLSGDTRLGLRTCFPERASRVMINFAPRNQARDALGFLVVIPEKPERQIAGTFSLGCRRWKAILSALSAPPNDELAQSGTEITLQKVLLFDELQVGLLRKEGSFRSQSLYVNYAIDGAHFSNSNEIKFISSKIELSFLYEWLGIETPKSSDHFNDDESYQIQISYIAPKPQIALTKKGEIKIRHSYSTSWHVRDGATVSGHTSFFC